jgi:hypothetical protein
MWDIKNQWRDRSKQPTPIQFLELQYYLYGKMDIDYMIPVGGDLR